MIDAALLVEKSVLLDENASLREEVRDLRSRLHACNLILARNVEELRVDLAFWQTWGPSA